MSTEFDTVIRGGQVVTDTDVIAADLAILDGKIAAIGPDLPAGRAEFGARGRFVMPGGVDPHAHIEQLSGMGVMNADTFETATRAAAMGGTTSVISFAAQQKGQTLRETVDDYAARADRGAAIDYAFHLSLSDVAVPGFEDDLAALVAAGHRSIKVFTTYNIRLDDRAILHVLAQARAHGALVCVHAENDGLIGWASTALEAAGLTAPRYHAVSHPRLAEIEAVERMCRFAEFFATPVMLFHISTREAVDVIRAARARGVPVWAETCPHYLLMTDAVLDAPGIEGAKWMCSPPQRRTDDQAALWDGLADGTLQVISSDHAPYRFDETGKLSAGTDAPFSRIANGLPGLEPRLPLMFDAMVTRGAQDPVAFAQATAAEPARIYRLTQKGRLQPGADADVVIWNPEVEKTWGANDLHDNVGYNPWVGRSVRGWPEQVFLRGTLTVDQGRYLGQPGHGRWQHRAGIGVAASQPPAQEVTIIEEAQT